MDDFTRQPTLLSSLGGRRQTAARRLLAGLISLAMLLVGVAAQPTHAQTPMAANQPIPFLILSQYVDGSGANKALELYNGTGSPVNLGQYRIEIYPNGASQPAYQVLLNNIILNNGETWIVVNPQASLILDALPGVPLQQDSNLVFDGNSTIVLKQNTTIVDSFGQRFVTLNPPIGWQGDGGLTSLGATLIRNPDVCSGRTNPDSPFNPSTEWYGIGSNNFSGLGSHTANCVPDGDSLLLNEFLIADNNTLANQYIEVFGLPGIDYAAYAILAVTGGQPNPGRIYRIYQVGVTSSDGYWTAFVNQAITPGANTFLLVRNLAANTPLGYDLDTNNDGVIDANPPWGQIVDSVALTTFQGSDLAYSPVVLTPNYDGRNRVVRGASRIPNGNTGQQPAAWRRNAGPPPGIIGLAVNTPNQANQEGVGTPTATPTATSVATTTPTVSPAPTATPTGVNTPLPTATPFPTAPPFTCAPPPAPTPPAGQCVNVLVNGDFETGGFPPWLPGQVPIPARVVADPSQASQFAALLGNPPGSGADTASFSSIRQLASIPPDASSVYLRWRTWEQTQEGQTETPSRQQDRHDAILLSEHLDPLEILSRSRCNYDTWYLRQADITQYRGRNLYVYFNAFNDGNDARTWQHLDTVELIVCYPEGAATPPPGPQPTAYPTSCAPGGSEPLPCPHGGPTDTFQIVTPAAALATATPTTAPIIIGASTTPTVEPIVIGPQPSPTVAAVPFEMVPLPTLLPPVLPPTEAPLMEAPPPVIPPTASPTSLPPTLPPPTPAPPTPAPPTEVPLMEAPPPVIPPTASSTASPTALSTAASLPPTAPPTNVPSTAMSTAATETPAAESTLFQEASPSPAPEEEPTATAGMSPAEEIGMALIEATRAARTAPNCVELLDDGDFEGNTERWQFTPPDERAVGFENELVHPTKGGFRALRIGDPAGMAPMPESAAERNLDLPQGYDSLVLTFDYLLGADMPVGEEVRQRADVFYMRSGQLARSVLNEAANDREWRLAEEDLSILAGQPIGLRFSVADDGSGTVMYIDNVSIRACQSLDLDRSGSPAIELTSVFDAPTATVPSPPTEDGAPSERESIWTQITGQFTANRSGAIIVLFSILVIIWLIVWGLRTMFAR